MPDCHDECGPIVERLANGLHVHENYDGRCYHSDEDDESVYHEDGDPILIVSM